MKNNIFKIFESFLLDVQILNLAGRFKAAFNSLINNFKNKQLNFDILSSHFICFVCRLYRHLLSIKKFL